MLPPLSPITATRLEKVVMDNDGEEETNNPQLRFDFGIW